MKNAFKIYKRDLKRVSKNWVAICVILGLMVLPSLYAWFNIKSSWDPYSNTKGILVAVVNKDKGAAFKDIRIDIGREIVDELEHNENIGWRFVDEKEAEWGVKHGKYYASVVIPENFSDRLLSVLRDKQVKPELIYSVNEKINAVAPKITSKGVTTVQSEVTKNFIKTVNGKLLEIVNKLGIELEKGKPKLKDLTNMIFYVDNKIPEINLAMDELEKGGITLDQFITKIQKDIPLIQDTITKATNIASTGANFLSKSKDALLKISPYIKEDLIFAKDLGSAGEIFSKEAANNIAENGPKAKELFSKAKDKFYHVQDRVNSVLDLLYDIDKNHSSHVINKMIDNITTVKDKLQDKINILDNIMIAIDNGQQPAIDLLNKLNDATNQITPILDNITGSFDSEITPAINDVISKLTGVADNTIGILNNANSSLPQLTGLLDKGHIGTTKGVEVVKLLKTKLPPIEKSIHEMATKLKKLDGDAQLNEIISLMRVNAVSESNFIANPIEVKENRIFPIPNYGSAMTPFFTILSLWVGALLLVSLLTVHVDSTEEFGNVKTFDIYLGRYFTFMSIAICQALIVTLGDIFLLKSYVSNKLVFVMFAVFSSIIFSMVIYTLVSVFGNVGKAIGVILLVLQISASGGTFPIQVTPPFFQKLNPFLPFTYAIGGMREAVGGIMKDMLIKDIAILSIYFIIALLLSIHLKERLSAINEKFVEKFKDTKLAGE